MNWIR